MYRKIIITLKVWKEIEDTIGNIIPEAGGILGRQNGKIVAYCFDRTGIFICKNDVYRNETDFKIYAISKQCNKQKSNRSGSKA